MIGWVSWCTESKELCKCSWMESNSPKSLLLFPKRGPSSLLWSYCRTIRECVLFPMPFRLRCFLVCVCMSCRWLLGSTRAHTKKSKKKIQRSTVWNVTATIIADIRTFARFQRTRKRTHWTHSFRPCHWEFHELHEPVHDTHNMFSNFFELLYVFPLKGVALCRRLPE